MKRSRSISASQGTQLVRSGTSQSYGSKRSRTTSKSRKSFGAQGVTKYTGFGFPPKLNIKHRYQEIFSLTTAAGGGTSTQQFRCNGMYDPNHSGTGHQPLYFDQVAAVYDHFTVLKSYLKLSLSTDQSNPQQVVVYINDDTTVTPSGMASLMEQSSAKYCTIVAGQPRVLTIPWDAYKTFGGSVLGNDNLQGSSAADPTEQSIFTIVGQAIDITKATNVLVNAEIVYYAVWDEVRDIAGS